MRRHPSIGRSRAGVFNVLEPLLDGGRRSARLAADGAVGGVATAIRPGRSLAPFPGQNCHRFAARNQGIYTKWVALHFAVRDRSMPPTEKLPRSLSQRMDPRLSISRRSNRPLIGLFGCTILNGALVAGIATAQDAVVSALPASLQNGNTPRSAASVAQRFAPGVLTTIEPQVDRADALSLHDVVEIRAQKDLDWTPASLAKSRTLYGMAAQASFPQDVWCLELSFKPLRMIRADVRRADGTVRNELVWYMVYRVRNTGVAVAANIASDGSFTTTEQAIPSIRFIPQFVLSSHDQNRDGAPSRKAYLDRVLPSAIEQITEREFRGGKLLSSVEMATQSLKLEKGRNEEGLWGVATWVGVDAEIDFFSVNVGGLTNAYTWDDPPGAYKAGAGPGAGRTFKRKVLQLNFWRPGDRYDQDEREIRFGAAPGKGALYDGNDGVTHRWVFR